MEDKAGITWIQHDLKTKYMGMDKSNNSSSLHLHRHENLKYSPKYGAYTKFVSNMH